MEKPSLGDRFQPKEIESKIYQWWQSSGFFKCEETSTKPPFSIVLPPPNVTGSLHLGHALNHAIQDLLVRWKRMSGFNVLWMPGTDHAGIATQMVVEKELAKEGLSRKQLGRAEFLKKVWAWKEQYGDRILQQARMLGDSCDWERHVFTLDEGVSRAVRRVFVHLYKKNWIYRGTRLVNWSPKLESAISDLEVEYREVKGHLWHIRYPLEDGKGELVVATTRPETLLGDTAVAVHPDDERYRTLLGKSVRVPLCGRRIPIISDTSVDREFGSGAVKITPAHDFNDYQMGVRHGLPMINIMNRDGTLNDEVPADLRGLPMAKARLKVVEALEKEGLLLKVEPHQLSVGHCSRSGCVAEPFLSDQWFVRTEGLSRPAKHTVENGTTEFIPELWTKTYVHWMNIIQDWCISRQLWWGHRIPAWTCQKCQHLMVEELAPTSCSKCQSGDLKQEEDVLDTWFSSALWPFSTMGWPDETELQSTFYPTTVLVTGFDIIFFWVARMMMMGLECKGDVPFRKVYIHGLIRDTEGRKMSKSIGNSVDPEELIKEFGADALRFTLYSQLAAGRDLKFSMQRLEGYRNFMNKIWNAARFSLGALEDFAPSNQEALVSVAELSSPDRWIIQKTKECEVGVKEALQQFRFSDAAQIVYAFAWHEFCDWYLEFIKPVIYGGNSKEKAATQMVLAQTLNRLVRLLHPFCPFITEEIYQKLPIKKTACMLDSYPTPEADAKWLSLASEEEAFGLDLVREVITVLRNIRGENQIKPGVKISARLTPSEDRAQKILQANKTEIMTLAKLEACEIGAAGDQSKCAVAPVKFGGLDVQVTVPLAGLVDFDEEIKRINKTLDRLQKEILGISSRLENKNFVDHAPSEVVEAAKGQLVQLQEQVAVLQNNLSRLR